MALIYKTRLNSLLLTCVMIHPFILTEIKGLNMIVGQCYDPASRTQRPFGVIVWVFWFFLSNTRIPQLISD